MVFPTGWPEDLYVGSMRRVAARLSRIGSTLILHCRHCRGVSPPGVGAGSANGAARSPSAWCASGTWRCRCWCTCWRAPPLLLRRAHAAGTATTAAPARAGRPSAAARWAVPGRGARRSSAASTFVGAPRVNAPAPGDVVCCPRCVVSEEGERRYYLI